MTQSYSFTIASTFEEVANLAAEAAALCARAGGSADLADSLRLCLAEALNNVVEHAYHGAPDRQIDVGLRVAADGFDVTITDTGAPMPGGVPPIGEPEVDPAAIDQLPEGGFGWMLIRSQVDRLDYQRRGASNVLRMGKTADA